MGLEVVVHLSALSRKPSWPPTSRKMRAVDRADDDQVDDVNDDGDDVEKTKIEEDGDDEQFWIILRRP